MNTQHRCSILNPDIVAEWAKEEHAYPRDIINRAARAMALLPEVRLRWPSYEIPRAELAARLWANRAAEACKRIQG